MFPERTKVVHHWLYMTFPESNITASKILDTLNSSVICLNRNWAISYVNFAAEELFSSSASRLYGKNIHQLFSQLEPNTITKKLAAFGGDSFAVTEHDARITLANGKSVSADYSIYPIDSSDETQHILLEIKPLDWQSIITSEEFTNLKKQASLQFAQGMAHEIKNPLSGIRGAAQLLERELNEPQLKQYTEVIISEVDRLSALINNMLGPNTDIIKCPVNILEVLEHIRRLMLAAESTRINIKIDYDPSIPELMGDKRELIQALLNIVQNAAQSIDNVGEITFKTRIGRRFTVGKITHPLVVQVDISDNGNGIPAEIRDTIFLPMVTNKAQGSGLGLPIAQEIVSRHGGIILFNSSPQGTTFSTILPLTLLKNEQ
ncbi:MAG: two-component system nitrogen regulation sensor histidine kinase GlnL [Polaribacter sp.]|jgi:two-component system nitrogen regulation sensor histidine kinase GlnL